MSVPSAAKATLWSSLDMVGRQAVQFLISIALARLLSPEEFGTFAIAAVFTALITVAIQGVLVTALVREVEASDADDSAVFVQCLAATALAGLAITALSGPLTSWYALPALGWLLPVMMVQVFIQALGSVHGARLNRALRFRALARIGIVSSLVGGAFAVGIALVGGGLWALAALATVPALVATVMAWHAEPWRPRLEGASRTRGHLAFSAWLSASSVLEVAYTQGIALVIGKLYGAADTGLYNRAAGLQALPGSMFAGVVARVLLPVAARVKDDSAALRGGLLRASRLAMLGFLPLMAGMAMTAESLIVTLFGEKWADAAPILEILAWAGAAYPLHVINLQLLLAIGRSDLFFRLETAKKAVGFPALVVGSLYGLMGLAWAQLAASLAAIVINIWPMGRIMGCGLALQLRNLGGIAAATAMMVGALALAGPHIAGSAPARFVQLVALGIASYAAALALLRPVAAREALALVRSREIAEVAP